MNKIIILLLTLYLSACSSSSSKTESNESKKEELKVDVQKPDEMPPPEGTKWRFKIAEGAYNYYQFTSETAYKYVSIEVEDTFYGNYEVKDDTLYLHQLTSAGDSLLLDHPNHGHKSEERKSKWVNKDGKLNLVALSAVVGDLGWRKRNPPSDIFYEQVE